MVHDLSHPRRLFPRRGRASLLASSLLTMGLLGGCNTLPDSGPVESTILNDAKKPDTNPLGFRIVPVTPTVVAALDAKQPALLSSFADGIAPRRFDARIGPGDTLQVSIFELGSGLFGGGGSSSMAGAAASNPLTSAPGPNAAVTSENMPPIAVDASGQVDIPYVGQLHAAGHTAMELAGMIRVGLKGQSQNPQVLVRISTDLANSVIVAGAVKKPGRLPLTLANEHLLDMIAIAGGPDRAPEDTEVRLVRGDETGTINLRQLEDDLGQNVSLAPGDRIELTYRPRSFTVFGATSRVSMVPFELPNLTLAEALAKIGGPLDERADPNAVFLFRFEAPDTARRLGLPVRPGVTAAPVVYKLDMMNPTSYFTAQRFAMENKDLIFIANAKTNKFYKFFNLISMLIGPGITAAYITKD